MASTLSSIPVSASSRAAASSSPSSRGNSGRLSAAFEISLRAGISLPMITFSLSPVSLSVLPMSAASVSTLVVSWKEAFAKKLSVFSDALVIPSSTGCAVAGSPPSASTLALISSYARLSTSSPGKSPLSPGESTLTLRSIWRTMISMCLSLIFTPCER